MNQGFTFLSQGPDLGARAHYAYTLCGWHTRSDIPLTCVPTSVGDNKSADILIQIAIGRSPIPKYRGWALFKHTAECSLIGVESVADFEVSNGRQIRIWPAPHVTQKSLEIFLCGPAWAALCHQRGILPLHASAVVSRRGITAFAGHPGAGKSTTAALMASLGHEVVADDILPISFPQGEAPGAWPYLRRLKLQRESITELALTSTELVSETLDKEKYFVAPRFVADDQWRKLERVYLLETNPSVSGISIDQITGAEAVRALVDQTYHFNFILDSGRFRDHLALCTRIASKTAIYRLRRAQLFGRGKELTSALCEHLEECSQVTP